MRIVPASEFDNVRLAAVFEAGYENYFTPIHVDEIAEIFARFKLGNFCRRDDEFRAGLWIAPCA